MTTNPAPDRRSIIFAMIENAAERGEPCPTNAVLATAIGASSMSGPVKFVNQLIEDGAIRVERSQRARVVTIVATGKTTALPQDKHLVKQHRSAAVRRDQLAELVAEGALLKDAARVMGLSEARVWQVWKQIKQGLGWLG